MRFRRSWWYINPEGMPTLGRTGVSTNGRTNATAEQTRQTRRLMPC
jgi:hypothetical protein